MPNETKPVKLFRRGQLLEIVPPVDGLIENTEFLNYEYVECASLKYGFTLKTKLYSMIWPNTDMHGHQYLQTFAGFEPEVRGFLNKVNKKYVLAGDRPKPLPDPTWRNLPGNKTGDRRLLRFVQHHERGLILYRESNVDIAWIIGQIALAYPKEKIVVIATRQADAAILAGRLRKYMSGISLAKPSCHPDTPSRVVIATTSGLQQSVVEVMKRTICICLNLTEVLSDKKVWFSSKDWLPVLKSRIYGLLNEDHSLAPQHLFLMSSLFGSQRLFIPKHGFRELPVHVTTWTFTGSNTLSVDATTLDIKKELIWRNPTRNRLIAGLAKAITESNDKALTKKYKSVAKAIYSKLGQRVAILVENVEHAARLHRWLPDWPIVAGKVSNTAKLTPKVLAAIEAGKQTTARKFDDTIVPTQGFAELRSIGILIRADAGTGLPPVSPDYFVSGDMVPASLTIIDMNDRHHPHLRQRSKLRRISYQKRGWKVDGCDRLSNHVDSADYTPEGFHPGRRRVTSGSYLPRQKGDRKIRTGQEAFAQRRKKRKRQKLLAKGMITLKLIADHELLLQCFKELRSEGGWGVGKDGISFASLSPGEWANVFRTLSKTLMKSRYRPLEARKVPIPKPGTSKKRILSIRSICDRVVAKALRFRRPMPSIFASPYQSWGCGIKAL